MQLRNRSVSSRWPLCYPGRMWASVKPHTQIAQGYRYTHTHTHSKHTKSKAFPSCGSCYCNAVVGNKLQGLTIGIRDWVCTLVGIYFLVSIIVSDKLWAFVTVKARRILLWVHEELDSYLENLDEKGKTCQWS